MSYQERMMSIQSGDDHSTAYIAGHIQACRSAAEIAIEADMRIAVLESALKAVEWIYIDGHQCPSCGGLSQRRHKSHCELKAALSPEQSLIKQNAENAE